MICDSCHLSPCDVRNELYSDSITSLREFLRLKKLSTVLTDMIFVYAFNETVDIIWERKCRCKCRVCMRYRYQRDRMMEGAVTSTDDSEQEYYSDESQEYCDNSGYDYYNCRATICIKCFLKGIRHLDRAQATLPFLRYHSNVFFNQPHMDIDPYKYVLPKHYNITYYRRKQPVRTADGKLHITST